MNKFRVILAVGLATMTFAAMAGGVANAAARKLNRSVVPVSATAVYQAPAASTAAPAAPAAPVAVATYSTGGAIY